MTSSYDAGIGPAGTMAGYALTETLSPYLAPRLPQAMRFNGARGDWELDDDGQFKAIHPVDQGVALALCVKRGDWKSSPKTGNTIFQVTLGAPDLRGQVESAVRTAVPLASYLADGSVEILRIDYEERPHGGIVVAVTYRNLVTAQVRQASSP